jgi:putative NADH-flavin reductase
MRVAVVGATGRTGGEVLRQARARGHEVVAVARRPQALRSEYRPTDGDAVGKVAVREADVLDAERLKKALEDAEVVVSAVGIGASRRPTRVYSAGTANVVRAMTASGATRLAVVSAAPAGPRAEQPPVQRRIALPLLERVFGATYADMRRMESLLLDSPVEWTVLRPPRLVDKPPMGGYRIDPRPLPRGGTIRIADLATALLDCLESTGVRRQALYVAN